MPNTFANRIAGIHQFLKVPDFVQPLFIVAKPLFPSAGPIPDSSAGPFAAPADGDIAGFGAAPESPSMPSLSII
jgi:hypothetical protein